MIYFDNSATGGFKPSEVYSSVNSVMRYLSANPGRSAHRLSLSGAQIVYSCRELLGKMFGAQAERVVFTKNCTEALNTAILGTLCPGRKVITTVYEHNSVIRPLFALKKKGLIDLEIISPSKDKTLLEVAKEKLDTSVYLFVCNSVCNVSGEVLPVRELGSLCKERGIIFLVDGAQGGGHIPLNLNDDNIDILCLAGHKGLCALMGTGVLIFKDNIDITPLTFGGTGTNSLNLDQPDEYPERLESGTLNLIGITSLLEGARYVQDNLSTFAERLDELTQKLISELSTIPKIKLYSKPNPAGIVAFSVEGFTSNQVADILNTEYDIAVRGGLHCATIYHNYIGTSENGLIRVSLCPQNTWSEIKGFISAIQKICK